MKHDKYTAVEFIIRPAFYSNRDTHIGCAMKSNELEVYVFADVKASMADALFKDRRKVENGFAKSVAKRMADKTFKVMQRYYI